MGELPSDPELLDWLATELIREDWSLKQIHRVILLSAATERVWPREVLRTRNHQPSTLNPLPPYSPASGGRNHPRQPDGTVRSAR